MNGARQPLLPFVVTPLAVLLNAMRRERVPAVTTPLCVGFYVQAMLACIRLPGAQPGWIGLHALLKRTETPAEVLRYILTHELLYIVVPPGIVDGKPTAHPSEFWAREQEFAPERGATCGWLWLNFHACLKEGIKRDCKIVKRGWRRMMGRPRATMEHCRAMLTDFVL